MKKLLATAFLSLVVLCLGQARASAFGCCGQCCKAQCCNPCCCMCCNAQYNAFSPMCQGVMVKKFFGLRKCCYPADICPQPCCPPPCCPDPCCAPGALPPAGQAGMMGAPYAMPQGMARAAGYQPSYNYGYPQMPTVPGYGAAMNNGQAAQYWNTAYQGR